MIHVMLASPSQAVRSGLRVMLAEKSSTAVEGDFSASLFISEASGLAEVGSRLDDVDVLVLTGDAIVLIELERLAGQNEGRLAVLLLTDQPQSILNLSRLPVRAWGALSLECSTNELQAAVRAVHEGLLVGAQALIGPGLVQLLAANRLTSSVEEALEPLTQRETEVLQLLAQGLANKQIAARLGISEHTVKFHVSSIYTKLGVGSRTEAVRCGVQQGLISL